LVPPAPPAPSPPLARAVRVEPGPNSTVYGARPEISASFDRPVDPNTVRLQIDGRDVTGDAYISPRAVSFEPAFDLPFGAHIVDVRVARVHFGWTFYNAPQPNPNYLSQLSPPNGARVGAAFFVQGNTRPYSALTLMAVADDRLPFGEINRSSVKRSVQGARRHRRRAHAAPAPLRGPTPARSIRFIPPAGAYTWLSELVSRFLGRFPGDEFS
jgi:hypothetical protein